MGYIIPAILLVVLVALIAWYFWPHETTVVAMGPYPLYGASMKVRPPIQLFDVSQTSKGFANNFTFSTYIYVSDVTKPAIGQQPPNTLIALTGAGSILIDVAQAKALLTLTPTLAPGQTATTTPSDPNNTITVPNFLTARWNQFAFTIEGRTVDVYLNGALVSSTLLNNVPLATPTQITLYQQPGYEGQVGYAQAWPRRLTMTEVIANYKATSDWKGKPAIPDPLFQWSKLLDMMASGFCYVGLCPTSPTNPLQFIQYEY